MAKKYNELSPDSMAKAGAILGFVMWILGFLWHGMWGQPSMMSLAYNMPYMSSNILGGSLLGLVVGGYVFGWLLAEVYNRMLK